MTFEDCLELPEKPDNPVDYEFIKAAIFKNNPVPNDENCADIKNNSVPTVSIQEINSTFRKQSQTISFKNRASRQVNRHTMKARPTMLNLNEKDVDSAQLPKVLAEKQEVAE